MSFDGSGSFRFSLSFEDKNVRSVLKIMSEFADSIIRCEWVGKPNF